MLETRAARRKKRHAIKAVATKIARQFSSYSNGKVTSYDEWLRWKIVVRAIMDLLDKPCYRRNAQLWLRGEMEVVQQAGVDPDWIRRQIRMAGIEL